MPYLNALNGTAFGRRYELAKPDNILGRHPECDIVLDAGAVSRQHAKIRRANDQFMLEDLKSRNGTFLNGRLISQPIALQDGDLIRICDLEFSFHTDVSNSEMYGSRVDGSSFGILLVDDPDREGTRSVTSKLDVLSSVYGPQISASSESKLAAIIEIMSNLGKAVALDSVLPKVLDSLFKIFMQADRGFIIFRESNGQLTPRWVKTRRDEQQETVRISRTVLNRVIDRKEAIISLDASNDERFEMSQSVTDFRIRSMIVAPLLDSERNPLGAIQIDTLNQRNRFEEKDLEVLIAVANQAGIAIENAQLHEQVIQQRLVEQDLQLAKEVQLAFLPREAPEIPGYKFYQYYHPANHIGGDYFDYIRLGPDRLAILVADVVGHGVAAAMFMAKLSAETRFAFARELSDPSAGMKLLNDRLTSLGIEKFVTMVVLILEPSTGKVTIANAGHMPPIYRTAAGEINEPGTGSGGLPLGIMAGNDYPISEMTLEPGALLVLYTDGVFEAPNPAGEPFSIKRLHQLVNKAAGSVEKTGSNTVAAVHKHIGAGSQEDDMCLVILGRLQ